MRAACDIPILKPMSDETPVQPVEAVAAARAKLPRPILLTIIGLGVAMLVALAVIIALVIPRASSPIALESPEAVPSASATPTRSPTPSATPSATPTPVVIAAPADPPPADPAPADPAPADPAPAPADPPPLPDPPAPVIPTPTITSMDAYYSGSCTTSTKIWVAWTSTDGTTANLNVRSGGGQPVFNQTWAAYGASDTMYVWLDCTRPLWYFKLTVSNSVNSKTGLLTFANGANQGWSSVAP